MTMERANPFNDLATDFAPKKAPAKPVEAAQIDRLAQENGFPSRERPANPKPVQRARRRYTTGRNQQINIKATGETIELFYRMADARSVPLGELLERALQALQTLDAPKK